VNPDLEFPMVVHNRIVKRRGQLQAVEEPGEPNAETLIEHLGDGLYRLTPQTGRTHQLRVHMASLGLPIVNDPLYPDVIDVAPDDFSKPLQLLAQRLEFEDREFVSRRALVTGCRPTPCPPRSPRDCGPPRPPSAS
jgi:tRNA pseudouridine32 synthase/23S rRNA pseudouridine746 synthase